MLNIDRDNRAFKKLEETKSDSIDAVTKPCSLPDMTFGMGKTGYPAICMTQLSAKMYCMWLSARTGRLSSPNRGRVGICLQAGTSTAYYFGDDPEKLPDSRGI